MPTVTSVLKRVILPAALAVTASGLWLASPAAAAGPAKGEETCDDAGAAARQGTKTGYNVKSVEGTGARTTGYDVKKVEGTGARGYDVKTTECRADGGDCDDADDKRKIEAIGVSHEIKSPRDSASGQASGKRQHCMAINTKGTGAQRGAPPEVDCSADHEVTPPRDASLGSESEKRACLAIKTKGTGAQRQGGGDDDCDGAAEDGVKAPRDVATGQASGREAASGKATGKQTCLAIKTKGTSAK